MPLILFQSSLTVFQAAYEKCRVQVRSTHELLLSAIPSMTYSLNSVSIFSFITMCSASPQNINVVNKRVRTNSRYHEL